MEAGCSCMLLVAAAFLDSFVSGTLPLLQEDFETLKQQNIALMAQICCISELIPMLPGFTVVALLFGRPLGAAAVMLITCLDTLKVQSNGITQDISNLNTQPSCNLSSALRR